VIKKSILLASVILAAFLINSYVQKLPSCYDAGLRKNVVPFYIQNAGYSFAENISLKNIKTLNVDKGTGRRTCIGQIMVFDKQSDKEYFDNELQYSCEWSEANNSLIFTILR
jgi:hypothetical protein